MSSSFSNSSLPVLSTGSISDMFPPDTGEFARIEKPAFVVTMFIMLAIAIVAASSHIALRLRRAQRLAADDIFLLLATLFMSVSTFVVFASRDYTYTQLNVSLAKVEPPADFWRIMVRFETLDNVATATVWAAIFCVKFSFVLFFRRLIRGVEGMRRLWWAVVAVLLCAAPTNMFLGFYICDDFSDRLLEICDTKGMVRREMQYLLITVCIDISTDFLVISIPAVLLARARLSFRRKAALAAVLSLSAFMILVATVRVAFASVTSPELQQNEQPAGVPRRVVDTVWLFFWQQMEACVAILMVSLTSLRSMLGQQKSSTTRGKRSGGDAEVEKGTVSAGGTSVPSRMPSRMPSRPPTAKSVGAGEGSVGESAQRQQYRQQQARSAAPPPLDNAKPQISAPIIDSPGKVICVAMTRRDDGPPVPPKYAPSPSSSSTAGIRSGGGRSKDSSPARSAEDVAMGWGRRPRSASFV